MTKRNYKHLFFDLDHTLWDFDRNSELTLQQLYQRFDLHGRGITDFAQFNEVYTVHNERLWERFRNGYMRREELRWKRMWHTLLDFKIGDTILAHDLSAAYLDILPTQTCLMPFAKELLEHCKGRYEIHMITNGFELTQWQKMRFSGIADFFAQVITSEKSHSLKPHPDIFDYALKATGATTEDSIMIGDALEIDVMGAYNAGWDTVYFNPKKTPHTRKPTYEVSCLSGMLEIF